MREHFNPGVLDHHHIASTTEEIMPKLVSISAASRYLYVALDADGRVWWGEVLASMNGEPKKGSPIKWRLVPSEFKEETKA